MCHRTHLPARRRAREFLGQIRGHFDLPVRRRRFTRRLTGHSVAIETHLCQDRYTHFGSPLCMKPAISTVRKMSTGTPVDAARVAPVEVLHDVRSQTVEVGVARAGAVRQAEQWLQDNQVALESSNAHVERHGLPLTRYRSF